MVSKKEVASIDFLWLSLYAFAGFSLELILDVVAKIIKGSSLYLGWHLVITSMVWFSYSFLLILYSKKRFKFDVFKIKGNLSKQEKTIIYSLAIFVIIVTTFLFKGFKPIVEFNNGSQGRLFLYFLRFVYYGCEAMLITLCIAFSQHFFDDRFKINSKIPMGGFFLAATWGVVHLFLQGTSGGLFAIFFSIIAGTIYTNCQKNFIKSYFFICLAFIL